MTAQPRRVVMLDDGQPAARPAIAWAARWAADWGHRFELADAAAPDAAEALIRASAAAAAVVVRRDHQELSALRQLCEAALGPLIIVPGGVHQNGGQIVVGIDGSPESFEAAEFAIGQARRWGSGVLAVLAQPNRGRADAGPAADLARIADELAFLARTAPDVPIGLRVADAEAISALIEMSMTAGLLVVASRGDGGRPGLSLGATARGVVAGARCPVVVLRSNQEPMQDQPERINLL